MKVAFDIHKSKTNFTEQSMLEKERLLYKKNTAKNNLYFQKILPVS